MKDISGAKIFCTALAALMFSLILIPAGYAAIGVKEGDWAKYHIEAQLPAIGEEDMGGIEDMEWAKFEVESVSDTTVTLEETVHYKNGTEGTETVDGTEIGFIIEANLAEGDQVTVPTFFGGGIPMYINGTVSRNYAGVNREVNYVNIEMAEYGVSMDQEAYWDKATGFLCEISISVSSIVYTMSISIRMTETNLWEAGLLSGQGFWILVVIIVVVVVAGSAVLLLRRRKAPLPEVTPAPTE